MERYEHSSAIDDDDVGPQFFEPGRTHRPPADPNRHERTLGGLLYGALHDKVWGAPKTEEEAKVMSAQHDEAVRLVADVASSLARVKTPMAGLLRIPLLARVNGPDGEVSLKSLVISSIEETAEGIALNRVAKLAGPGGHLDFGSGILNTGKSQFLSGALFGAVRTGFEDQTWLDPSGRIDLAKGPQELVAASLVNGIASIPAGILGGTAARLAGAGVRDGLGSRIAVGTASGAVTGGVFSLVDSIAHPGLERSYLDAFVSGAEIGAITGGATSAIPGGMDSPLARGSRRYDGQWFDESPYPNLVTSERNPLTRRLDRFFHPDLLLASSENPPKFSSLVKELGPVHKGEMKEWALSADAPKKFDSFEHFEKFVVQKTKPALAYQFGPTKILVPEHLEQKYEEARQWRLGNGDPAKPKPEFANKLLPEDMVGLLKLLPDRALVRSLTLADKPYLYDAPKKQFRSGPNEPEDTRYHGPASAVNGDADVTFFNLTRNSRQAWVMRHEQVHSNHDQLFGTARKLDRRLEATRYAFKNDKESEAEMESKAFLSSNLKTLFDAADRAPVRMTLLSKKLTDTINNAEPENRSIDSNEILARAKFVQAKSQDRAVSIVANALDDKVFKGESADDYVKLLARISEPGHKLATDAIANALKNGDAKTAQAASETVKSFGEKNKL